MVNRWGTSREKSMKKNQMKIGEFKNTSEIKKFMKGLRALWSQQKNQVNRNYLI